MGQTPWSHPLHSEEIPVSKSGLATMQKPLFTPLDVLLTYGGDDPGSWFSRIIPPLEHAYVTVWLRKAEQRSSEEWEGALRIKAIIAPQWYAIHAVDEDGHEREPLVEFQADDIVHLHIH